jgi:phosphatidate phosphatase APP1
MRSLLLALLLLPSSALGASDEVLVLFPTYAAANGEKATLTVRAWVYEPEEDSTKRRLFVDELALLLDVKQAKRPIFDRRTRSFLVDNERGKRVRVEIDGQTFDIGETEADGHAERTIEVKRTSQADLRLRASADGLSRELLVPVIAPEGVSIVSDIDDTIKVTEVLDKKALLANTFLEEFRAVDGMAPLYAKWAKEGMQLHYLSASPWQLEEELRVFLERSGFPRGPLHLRKARTNSLKTPLVLIAGAREHKLAELTELLRRFPARRFILIGDSGEQDPEIYGEIFRAAPKQIDRIAIRKVKGADHASARWDEAFAGVPREKWRLFDDPKEL